MRRRSVGLLLGGLLLLGLVALGVWRARSSGGKPSRGEGGPPGAGAPVPVVVAAAERKDVPVYLEGVGTVTAYQAVTVRTRVDGQLERIAFKEGQDVQPGELLAQLDARPFQAALDQAVAKKAQDAAALANSKLDLERYRVLVERNLIQRQTLDTQAAQVAQQEALVRADQAAIDTARVQLSYTRITAPIPGRTGLRLVDVGNIVHAADANGLVVLTQLQPISLVFTLPEQHVSAINEQQAQHRLPVDAVAADGQTVLDHGELLLVDNQIDVTTGTVRLKAVFPNAGHKLWPGQFVNGRLQLTVRRGSTVVPSPAVQRGPQGPFAYVLKPDNTVELRQLKVAQIRAGEALIDEGVNVGERVVVEGQYKLQPGSRVVPQAQGAGGGTRRPQEGAPAQSRPTPGEGRP